MAGMAIRKWCVRFTSPMGARETIKACNAAAAALKSAAAISLRPPDQRVCFGLPIANSAREARAWRFAPGALSRLRRYLPNAGVNTTSTVSSSSRPQHRDRTTHV